jgi:hypothetical protein
MQETVEGLYVYSATVEAEVTDALNSAKSVREFSKMVKASMDALIDEAEAIKEVLG